MTGQPTAPIQDGLAWIRQPLTLLAVPRLATSGVRPQHAKVLGGLIHTSTSGPHDGLRLSRNVAGSDDDKGIGTLQVLVAQHEQLHVPGQVRADQHRQQAEQAPHQPVEQRQQHSEMVPATLLIPQQNPSSNNEIEFPDGTGCGPIPRITAPCCSECCA